MDKSAFILLLMLCQLFLTTAARKRYVNVDFYILSFNLSNTYFTINNFRTPCQPIYDITLSSKTKKLGKK